MKRIKTKSKTKKTANKKEKITKNMLIGEIVTKYPESSIIFMNHGLHCIGCHISPYETLEQGCKGHGMNEKDMNKLLKDLNKIIKK